MDPTEVKGLYDALVDLEASSKLTKSNLQKKIYNDAIARAVTEVERLGMLLSKDKKTTRDEKSTLLTNVFFALQVFKGDSTIPTAKPDDAAKYMAIVNQWNDVEQDVIYLMKFMGVRPEEEESGK
jgi:hypothetical protein